MSNAGCSRSIIVILWSSPTSAFVQINFELAMIVTYVFYCYSWGFGAQFNIKQLEGNIKLTRRFLTLLRHTEGKTQTLLWHSWGCCLEWLIHQKYKRIFLRCISTPSEQTSFNLFIYRHGSDWSLVIHDWW